MRRFAWFAALAALTPACGGDGGVTPPLDALDAPIDAVDALEIDAPAATARTYVASLIDLPATAGESQQLGLDIDERPNDGIDNQLGMLLAALRSLAPAIDLQVATDRQVDRGELIWLAYVHPTGFAGEASLELFTGANPQPPACLDASDTTCRRHLTGTAQFDVAAGSSADSEIPGSVLNDRFTGANGYVILPLALSAGNQITLRLWHAKAEVAITPSGFGLPTKIGGAIAQTDVDAVLIPGLHVMFTGLVDQDCPPPRSPPSCNCSPGSSGQQVLGFLDGNDDCQITVAEVETTINGILTPDIDLDGNGVNDAVSLGVGVRAVLGSFTPP